MLLDIAPSEFLLIAAVAIVCIGPKDMPRALRSAGRWVGKMRRVSGHFRAGMENLIREAELQEMEQIWAKQNEAIMRAHPALPGEALGQPAHLGMEPPAGSGPSAEGSLTQEGLAPANTAHSGGGQTGIEQAGIGQSAAPVPPASPALSSPNATPPESSAPPAD